MFCKAHGGGKRCIIQDCNKGAEGSTPLCKGHGGGKRCAFDGGGICTKSVHGGTLFCVAHGGGKRCAVEGCGKSARGRTDFCVRHGGGKRCKVDECGKSAQGSTDFCKAHGGGKRCQWGQEGSNFGDVVRDKNGEQVSQAPCDKFARGKTGLCAAHSALVSDRQVHGGNAVGSAVTPGLAPGLFRGLATGAGQNRPSALATTSTGTQTAVTGVSTPVASVSVEMSKATDSPVVSGIVALTSTYVYCVDSGSFTLFPKSSIADYVVFCQALMLLQTLPDHLLGFGRKGVPDFPRVPCQLHHRVSQQVWIQQLCLLPPTPPEAPYMVLIVVVY